MKDRLQKGAAKSLGRSYSQILCRQAEIQEVFDLTLAPDIDMELRRPTGSQE
ncbi:MAG TPA: hypothetical protein VIH18_07760 [Candidatus Binatia bacterium]|jgi:hypothetical protein